MFEGKLKTVQAKNQTDVALLLRPLMREMPAPMHYYDDPFFPFSKAIIVATREVVCAYVFDFAAYMVHGAAGAVALERSMAFAGTDVVKVLHGAFVGAGYIDMVYENAFGADAATIAFERDYEAFTADSSHEAYVVQWGDIRDVQTPTYWIEHDLLTLPGGVNMRLAGESVLYTGYQNDFAEQCRKSLEDDVLMAYADLAFEDLLLKYGLIQFGRFKNTKGEFVPCKLNLDWTPSYPDVLKAAAFEVQEHFCLPDQSIHQFERILCPFDTLPVATLVSAETGISLVYSRGRGEPTVHDLVGAYDINHPTLLLTNSDVSDVPLGDLSKKANRVGLKVSYTLALVETFEIREDESPDFCIDGGVISILSLVDMALAAGLITPAFNENVKNWLDDRYD